VITGAGTPPFFDTVSGRPETACTLFASRGSIPTSAVRAVGRHVIGG